MARRSPSIIKPGDSTKDIVVHRAQARVLMSDRRFILAAAGTGGGKTYVGALWLALQIARNPGQQWIITAPTHTVLRDVTLPTWMNCVRGTKLEGRYKKSDKQYRLPDGGVIYLASAENPNSIEGKHVSGAWCDEAGQYVRWAWVVIQARVGNKMGRVLFTTTPYALNWLFDEIYLPWKSNRDTTIDCINWATAENPSYPRDEIERARASLSPEVFSMRYLGEFVRREGLVYPEYQKWLADRAEPFGPVRRYGGIDFGFHNAMVKYDAMLDAHDVLWLDSEYYKRGGLLEEMAATMRIDTDYAGDPSGAQWIAELKRKHGYRVHPAINDVEPGIEAVTARGRTNRLRIVGKRCPELVDCLASYHRNDKTMKPVKEDDDPADAMRYLIMHVADREGVGKMEYTESGRAATFDVPRIGRGML